MKKLTLAIICVVGLFGCKENQVKETTPQITQSEVKQISVTSLELLKDFKNTEAYVAKKYSDVSVINVSGQVSDVFVDSVGSPVIKFKTMDDFGFDSPLAGIADESATKAMEVKKGDTVTVSCTLLQNSLGTPVLKGCYL